MLSCVCPSSAHHPLHCILPPYVLERLSQSGRPQVRRLAIRAIEASAEARAVRRTLGAFPSLLSGAGTSGKKNRQVHDAKGRGQQQLPGTLVRSEGQPRVADPAVNEAYDHSGATWDFYNKCFSRNSLDGRGMPLVSSVHLMRNFNNAFWNGQQMAYGDGDGEIFQRFTRSLDVVGHELTHGVVSHECALVYQGQSGALNEHFADAFGVMVKQWKKRQTVDKADWLIGAEIMAPASGVKALRTFSEDRAYENSPDLGTDPQPKHRRDMYKGMDDNGGVHLNSGIPNHAFYRFARELGGKSWEVAGPIWYETMRKLSSDSTFEDMIRTTEMIADKNHGAGSRESKALAAAWKAVGY